jgi:hypothetical protein
MSKQIINCLKAAWLATTIVVFVMGTSLCATTEEACFESAGMTFALVFLLSFPGGFIFLYASLLLLEPAVIHFAPDDIWLWLIMAIGGFIQWFVAIPRMFRKDSLIVLNLKADVPPPERAVEAVSIKQKAKRKRPIRAFDTHGRTPFERVIARHS